jgi:hypothetical protein
MHLVLRPRVTGALLLTCATIITSVARAEPAPSDDAETEAPQPPDGAVIPPRLLAILPFVDNNDETRRMDSATKVTLEETIRTASGDVLGPWNYTILSSDNMLSILADNGIDPGKACEASCSLQAARELKADNFVAGSVALTEGQYIAILRLFEAKSGRQLSSVVLEGATVRDIRKAFGRKAANFFKHVMNIPKAGSVVAAPPPKPPPPPVAVVEPPKPPPPPVALTVPEKVAEPVKTPEPAKVPAEALGPPPAKGISAGRGVGIALLVVGGLGLAAGTAFGVMSSQTQAHLKVTQQSGAAVAQQVKTANSQALGADVMWGAGGVLAALGVGLVVAF